MNDIKDFLEEKIGESHIVEDILTDYHRDKNRKIMREKVLPNLIEAYYTYQLLDDLKPIEDEGFNISQNALVMSRIRTQTFKNRLGEASQEHKTNYMRAFQAIYVEEGDLTYQSSSPIFIKNKKYYLEEKNGESHIVEDNITDYHRNENRKIMREKVLPNLAEAYFTYKLLDELRSREGHMLYIPEHTFLLNRLHIQNFKNGCSESSRERKIAKMRAFQAIYVEETTAYHSSSPIFKKNKKHYQ